MEVIDTNSGVSHLFVCGRWLSRGAAEHREPDGSNLDENEGVKLERVDGSESDIRVSICIQQPSISSTPVLYRLQFVHVMVSSVTTDIISAVTCCLQDPCANERPERGWYCEAPFTCHLFAHCPPVEFTSFQFSSLLF